MFLISTLDGGEWSASRLCSSIQGERAPVSYYKGGCLGARADLVAVEKILTVFLCWKIKPDPSAVLPVA
jgi:hypothetical protein